MENYNFLVLELFAADGNQRNSSALVVQWLAHTRLVLGLIPTNCFLFSGTCHSQICSASAHSIS